MFRFFAFIATLLTFVGGLDDKASSIWFALCIISSGLMFVGLKPFLDRPVERVISKDKNYLITISLALFIFGDKEKMNPEFYLGACIVLGVVLINGIIKNKSVIKKKILQKAKK